MTKIIHIERIEAETKSKAIKKARKVKFITIQRNGINYFANIVLSKLVSTNREGVFEARYKKRKN